MAIYVKMPDGKELIKFSFAGVKMQATINPKGAYIHAIPEEKTAFALLALMGENELKKERRK